MNKATSRGRIASQDSSGMVGDGLGVEVGEGIAVGLGEGEGEGEGGADQ